MFMISFMSRLGVPVMFVFFMVELIQIWDVALCGSELCYLLDGMALCVMLYLLFYASIINESCYNA